MKKMLLTLALCMVGWSQAQAAGTLQVQGAAGARQVFKKVKAVKCSTTEREKCDEAIFFDLNKGVSLPAGSYIVGFENSIYPGRVEVRDGASVTIYLEKLTIPSSIRGDKIKVYRDFSSNIEQRKVLDSLYAMKRHFFRLNKTNLGDLYLAGQWDAEFVQRLAYAGCASMQSDNPYYPEDARAVCAAWKGARNGEGLRPLFTFNSDGTLEERWVTRPGDINKVKHPRYLVSIPVRDTDFVGVFPGVYKVQGTGAAVTVKVGRF